MNRRRLLVGGAVDGSVALAAPAIARSAPEIHWRGASSFRRSRVSIFGAGEIVGERIATEDLSRTKVYAPRKAFRGSEYQWFRVAENSFDNFVYIMQAQEQRR